MAIDASGMIDVAEAARRLHLSRAEVRRRLRQGRLRGQRLGQHWLVEASAAPASGAGSPRLIPPEQFARIRDLRRKVAPEMAGVDIVELIREHREQA